MLCDSRHLVVEEESRVCRSAISSDGRKREDSKGRNNKQGEEVLHKQFESRSQRVKQGDKRALVDRELAALGVGYSLQRGRQPDKKGQRAGECGDVEAHSVESVEAG